LYPTLNKFGFYRQLFIKVPVPNFVGIRPREPRWYFGQMDRQKEGIEG